MVSAHCPPGPLQGIRVIDLTTVRIRHIKVPVKFSKTPGGLRRHAERLGGSSAEVLRELGYAQEQIAALTKSASL